MDHRIIIIGSNRILLDRIIADETAGWQVITSTFVTEEFRNDEWVFFEVAQAARQYIKDFTSQAAKAFLERSLACYQSVHGHPPEPA